MKSTTIVSATAFIAGVVMAVTVKILVDMKMFSPDKYKDGVHLVFAIMSAPDHFEERQAIRETWLPQQNTTDKRFRGWFIIGNKSCDVHPDNRVDIYGCERIQFAYQENFENVKFVTGERIREKKPVSSMPLKHVLKQLNFKVLHPLKVKQLGVLSEALEGQNRTVTVTITCRASQEVSAMASFSFKDQGMSDGIYNYQPVRETTLPKGFEGSLSVEGLQEEQDFQNYVTVFENFGGILELQRIWRRLPSTEDVVLMSLTANVKDAGVWSQKVKTYKLLDEDWRQHQLDVQRKLKKESEIFGDILFIDVIDVYRNLPKKLLHFHKWVYDEMKVDFVLKTDDDCYVDLEKVVSTLKRDKNQLLDKLIWWGSFREQWLVETHGKWAELDYAVDVYPRFACGGGNVVSQQIHQWLAENHAHLHSFQGEDVSMGIWLASLAVEFVHDKNWRCSKECDINMYSMPQLSPRELKQMWARRQQCHNPCSCSEKPDSNNN